MTRTNDAPTPPSGGFADPLEMRILTLLHSAIEMTFRALRCAFPELRERTLSRSWRSNSRLCEAAKAILFCAAQLDVHIEAYRQLAEDHESADQQDADDPTQL